jgi:hypothetical protein
MPPKIQFLFFFLASLCFFLEVFTDTTKYVRRGLIASGLCLFAIPFAYNAATAGW